MLKSTTVYPAALRKCPYGAINLEVSLPLPSKAPLNLMHILENTLDHDIRRFWASQA